MSISRLKEKYSNDIDYSFKPRINKTNISEGCLNLSEPDTLKELLIKKEMKLQLKRYEESKQKEIEELKECTFKPTTTEIPKYITEISESMKIAKKYENNLKKKEKPSWR